MNNQKSNLFKKERPVFSFFIHHLSFIIHHSKKKGFTLIEIMVVIAIMALIMGMAIRPVFKSLSKIKARTAVKQLAATLRYARSQAVAFKKVYQVAVNLEEESYWVVKAKKKEDTSIDDKEMGTAEEIQGEEEVSQERQKKEFIEIIKFPEEIEIKSFWVDKENELTDGMIFISFYPLGNSSGGKIIIGKEDKETYKIVIDPIVGRAKIGDAGEEG
ncbi:MAG: prepilin-type N-terminal cleavage/methylation domain-containing protein [bacterium]